jgi:hypothetical protein
MVTGDVGEVARHGVEQRQVDLALRPQRGPPYESPEQKAVHHRLGRWGKAGLGKLLRPAQLRDGALAQPDKAQQPAVSPRFGAEMRFQEVLPSLMLRMNGREAGRIREKRTAPRAGGVVAQPPWRHAVSEPA